MVIFQKVSRPALSAVIVDAKLTLALALFERTLFIGSWTSTNWTKKHVMLNHMETIIITIVPSSWTLYLFSILLLLWNTVPVSPISRYKYHLSWWLWWPWWQTWGRGWWSPPRRTLQGSHPDWPSHPGSDRRSGSHCWWRFACHTHSRQKGSDGLNRIRMH